MAMVDIDAINENGSDAEAPEATVDAVALRAKAGPLVLHIGPHPDWHCVSDSTRSKPTLIPCSGAFVRSNCTGSRPACRRGTWLR